MAFVSEPATDEMWVYDAATQAMEYRQITYVPYVVFLHMSKPHFRILVSTNWFKTVTRFVFKIPIEVTFLM